MEDVPDDAAEGLYAVNEVLFVEFAHGVCGVADLDGDFAVFQFVEVDFADDFAVVFVAVGAGIDEFDGVARVGAETGLTVGHPEAVEPPGEEVADGVGENLVSGHAFGRGEESAAEDDIAVSIEDWSDEGADIAGVVLAVAVHGHDNTGAETFGRFDAGFGGAAFAAIEFVAEDGVREEFPSFLGGVVAAAVIDDDDVSVAGSLHLADDILDDGGFIVGGDDDPDGGVFCL